MAAGGTPEGGLDGVLLEDRVVAGVEPHLVLHPRQELADEVHDLPVQVVAVHPDRIEAGREDIADVAEHQRQLGAEARRGAGQALAADGLPVALDARDVGGERLLVALFRGRPRFPFPLHGRSAGDQRGDPHPFPRSEDAPLRRDAGLREGPEVEATALQVQPAGEPVPLPRERFPGDLDEHHPSRLEEFLDARPFAPAGAVPGGVAEERRGGAGRDLVRLQERVPMEADVHERRLGGGHHPLHAAPVDPVEHILLGMVLEAEFHDLPVFEERDSRLAGKTVDDQFAWHRAVRSFLLPFPLLTDAAARGARLPGDRLRPSRTARPLEGRAVEERGETSKTPRGEPRGPADRRLAGAPGSLARRPPPPDRPEPAAAGPRAVSRGSSRGAPPRPGRAPRR